MRNDDPSQRSRRPRRKKPTPAADGLAHVVPLAPPPRKRSGPPQLDSDFGLALCLGSALVKRRLPEA